MLRALLLILLALEVAAARPAEVAMLVESTEDFAAPLKAALADENPPTRAAAARVIAVKDLRSIDLRTALKNEKNAEAARELIRAIGIFGGAAELDFLLGESKRFHSALDGDVWIAVARGGGPAAVEAFFARKPQGERPWLGAFFRTALWGRPQLAATVSSRLLGMANANAWHGWLAELDEIGLTPTIAMVALQHASPRIATDTAWHLLRSGVPPSEAKRFMAALEAAPAKDVPADLAFARELLHRSLGRPPQETPLPERFHGSDEKVIALLTREEARALKVQRRSTASANARTTRTPQFYLLQSLPKGIAEELVRANDCTSDWTGLAIADVDEAGRVKKLDLSGMEAVAGCMRVLGVLLRMSLAEPHSIASGRSAIDVLLVRDHRGKLCLDEPDAGSGWSAPQRLGGRVQAPKVTKRVPPEISSDIGWTDTPDEGTVVVVEAVINRHGCISRLRLLQHATDAAVNRAVLLALSRWELEPGTLDGKPVDVIHDLTINFRLDKNPRPSGERRTPQ